MRFEHGERRGREVISGQLTLALAATDALGPCWFHEFRKL
jgi:hypothetical protein